MDITPHRKDTDPTGLYSNTIQVGDYTVEYWLEDDGAIVYEWDENENSRKRRENEDWRALTTAAYKSLGDC